MFARKLFDALTTTAANAQTTAHTVKMIVAEAWLAGETKRAFMADFRKLTNESLVWNTAENYAGRAWSCLGFYKLALAQIWLAGSGSAISEVYKSIPKKQTGRKKLSRADRVVNAFARLPLAEKSDVLARCAKLQKQHEVAAAEYEKAVEIFKTLTVEV